MNKNYFVQLNIQDDFDKPIGVVKLNETDSIVLNINLVQNGAPFDLSTASYSTMAVIKPDGTFNNGYCEIVDGPNGKIKFILPVNCVNLTGVYRGEVQVFDGTTMISTAAFSYEVKNSLLRDEGVTTQPEYPILVALIDQVDGIVETEAGRVIAENGRVSAESTRVTNESSRVLAESTRASNEVTRQSQETSRVSAESARITAESSRTSSETARASAESTRVSQESTRQSNESARATAESGRVTAESNRVTAENARISAEGTRSSNESTRVTQESGRVTAEGVRVTEFQAILDQWEAIQDADVRVEVIAARNSFPNLDSRLDDSDTRMIAKLDTTAYTANDVLTKIKTVDGTGSGLDADTLDGKHASEFVQNADFTAANDFIVGTGAGTKAKKTLEETRTILGVTPVVDASETTKGIVELATAAEVTTGTDTTRVVTPAGLKVELDKKLAITSYTAADVLTKIKTVDGLASGLEADTVPGYGIGVQTTSEEVDLNNYTLGGTYVTPSSGLVNLPAGWTQTRHTVIVGGGANYRMQILVNDSDKNKIAFRVATSTTYGTWNTMFNSGNYGFIISRSGGFTLALTDRDSIINMNTGGTITIPSNADVAFPIGTQVVVLSLSATSTIFAPASGVTLRSKDTKRTIDGLDAGACLIKIGTDVWQLIGSLKA